jgi:FtsH-binding integral membrane protein
MINSLYAIPKGIPPEYSHGINLYMWIGVTALLLINFVLFLIRARKVKDIESQRQLLNSYGIFCLGQAGVHIFFLLAFNLTENYDIYINIAYVCGTVALLPVTYFMEKYILPQSRHFFFIVAFCLMAVTIYALFDASQTEFSRSVQRIASPVIFGMVAILCIYMIIKSSGFLRKRAFMIMIGLGIMSVAMLLDSNEFVIDQTFPLWISPSVFAVGTILFGFSMGQESK